MDVLSNLSRKNWDIFKIIVSWSKSLPLTCTCTFLRLFSFFWTRVSFLCLNISPFLFIFKKKELCWFCVDCVGEMSPVSKVSCLILTRPNKGIKEKFLFILHPLSPFWDPAMRNRGMVGIEKGANVKIFSRLRNHFAILSRLPGAFWIILFSWHPQMLLWTFCSLWPLASELSHLYQGSLRITQSIPPPLLDFW